MLNANRASGLIHEQSTKVPTPHRASWGKAAGAAGWELGDQGLHRSAPVCPHRQDASPGRAAGDFVTGAARGWVEEPRALFILIDGCRSFIYHRLVALSRAAKKEKAAMQVPPGDTHGRELRSPCPTKRTRKELQVTGG